MSIQLQQKGPSVWLLHHFLWEPVHRRNGLIPLHGGDYFCHRGCPYCAKDAGYTDSGYSPREIQALRVELGVDEP